jgi:hypothetical protein
MLGNLRNVGGEQVAAPAPAAVLAAHNAPAANPSAAAVVCVFQLNSPIFTLLSPDTTLNLPNRSKSEIWFSCTNKMNQTGTLRDIFVAQIKTGSKMAW